MSGNKKHPKERDAFENRELSWLRFNARVQEEANRLENPLLERAKFVSIVSSNMDEFFQVRYHRVFEKRNSEKKHPSGKELYEKLNRKIEKQVRTQYQLHDGIISELYSQGVLVFPAFSRTESQMARENDLFQKEILPYLKAEAFPDCLVKQKQLYLCVKLIRRKGDPFRLIAMPAALSRIFNLSSEKEMPCLIRLEDIVKHHVQELFPRDTVEHAAFFRILRNQDFEVEERLVEDIEPAVHAMLSKRAEGAVMRLAVEEGMSEEMLTLLKKEFHLCTEQIFRAPGPLDLNKLMSALSGLVKRSDLKYPSAKPAEVPELMGGDFFDRVEEKDYLLFHPYHSFDPVVHMLELAAADPDVRAIRQTLYRVSGNSPIVAALETAAENGKDVFILFEAHARFDEENNLYWAERLRRAGVKVQYGLPNLKVHSKITYVERCVNGITKRCIHLGTGNYHDGTAKLYTDFGLLTSDHGLCADAEEFFRQFDGTEINMREIVQAPDGLQPRISELIANERAAAREGRPAHILAKMNSINDPKIIGELMEASQDGVHVDLLVRGICCVLPGLEGLTENIRVRSIVGRNLEHARAFVFENGGDHLVFLSSADWMGRNLYKRVELMFPVKDGYCRQAVENVLRLQWNDTEKCRRRTPKGKYKLTGDNSINAQEIMLRDINGVFAGTDPVFDAIPPLFQDEDSPTADQE